ncbi:PRC-barrel domain-containing protein [Actibacterium sp. D379-3]
MRKLIASSAMILVLAGPALSESHGMTDDQFVDFNTVETGGADLRASELLGKRVYTAKAGTRVAAVNEADENWEDIGEINDVILSRDGSLEVILVDIGGFLGIGEKTVAVNMSQLNMVADSDDEGEYFIVFNADRAQLENAPEFDAESIGTWWDDLTSGKEADMNTDAALQDGTKADSTMAATDQPRTDTDATADTDDALDMQVPDVTVDGYVGANPADLTAEDLTGASVRGINDERVGEISDLVIEDDKISAVVIEVGGFLGLGEKPVVVEMERLNIQRSEDGDDLRIYIDADKEALKALPEYQG